MHTVDLLPIIFVGGVFLFLTYKIVAEYVTVHRIE
jgi:hypothetical protein